MACHPQAPTTIVSMGSSVTPQLRTATLMEAEHPTPQQQCKCKSSKSPFHISISLIFIFIGGFASGSIRSGFFSARA